MEIDMSKSMLRLCTTHEQDLDLLEATSMSLPPATREALHLALCDNCDSLILGTRYKCVVCDDYDLCEFCELENGNAFFHQRTHPFVRLQHPIPSEDLRPSLFFPSLIELSEEEKSVDISCSICGESIKLPPNACFYCLNCPDSVCTKCELDHNDHHAMLKFYRPPPAALKEIPMISPLCHCAPRSERGDFPSFDPDAPPAHHYQSKTDSGEGVGKGETSETTVEHTESQTKPIFSVRGMTMDDLDIILEIDKGSFAHPWSADSFIGLLTTYKDRIAAFVAVDIADPISPRIVGYTISEDRIHTNEIYVMSLAVHSDYRRKGLGRLLLEHVLRIAYEEKQFGTALLHANVHNLGARRLYERLGFFPVEVVEGYYKKEGDAHLMKAVLPILSR